MSNSQFLLCSASERKLKESRRLWLPTLATHKSCGSNKRNCYDTGVVVIVLASIPQQTYVARVFLPICFNLPVVSAAVSFHRFYRSYFSPELEAGSSLIPPQEAFYLSASHRDPS